MFLSKNYMISFGSTSEELTSLRPKVNYLIDYHAFLLIILYFSVSNTYEVIFMKCVLYVRVSTEEQAKHGYSIAAQQEKLEAFCASQGWEIIDTYIDEGYSAKDLNRPKFQLMIEEIKKKEIDVLLVYRLDRLTRSVLDLYKILKILEESDCSFKSATEVYDTTNAMGRLFITLAAGMAQWERENLAERVRLGIEKKTKMGKWKGGVAPYGYTYKNDELKINTTEAPIVKKIFELSRTYGFVTVAKKLNESGCYTKSNKDWHVDTVRGIANNPVYAGYLTFNETLRAYKKPPREQKLYEGIHERIIPRDEFWSLQDVLDTRRGPGGKRQTSNYFFSTILKCGRCGHSMSGHRGSVGQKTYRCSGKKSGKTCSSHIILESTLVKKIFERFNELVDLVTPQINTETQSSTRKVKELEAELSAIEKSLTKHKKMYERDIIDIDELVEKTEELRQREKDLTKELQNYKRSHENIEDISFIARNIESLWSKANDSEKKQMMCTLFSQIVIDTEEEYKRGTGIPREIIIVSVK
ncbi:recombinase family protein [Bacillus sp. SH5-2]|nr:recombinase family protein [Bacillus sp. SH5-2]